MSGHPATCGTHAISAVRERVIEGYSLHIIECFGSTIRPHGCSNISTNSLGSTQHHPNLASYGMPALPSFGMTRCRASE